MAIVKGRPRKDCMAFLKNNKIEYYFSVCVCMENGPPKPDPFPVLRACVLLNEESSKNVVMVGDTLDDIRAAGCVCLGVATLEDASASKKEGLSFD